MGGLRVLVTRPQPDAARTASKLAGAGHYPLVEPLLELDPLKVEAVPSGPFAAVAITSANAARALRASPLLPALLSLPVLAVGERSADAARLCGFRQVVAGNEDASALARLIAARLPRGARVLHLAGEDRARDLRELLAESSIHVEVLVLYRMRAVQSLSPTAVAAIGALQVDAALHFSARSAATFTSLVARHGLIAAARAMRHLCISQPAAAPLLAIEAPTKIASRPVEAALFDLLTG